MFERPMYVDVGTSTDNNLVMSVHYNGKCGHIIANTIDELADCLRPYIIGKSKLYVDKHGFGTALCYTLDKYGYEYSETEFSPSTNLIKLKTENGVNWQL